MNRATRTLVLSTVILVLAVLSLALSVIDAQALATPRGDRPAPTAKATGWHWGGKAPATVHRPGVRHVPTAVRVRWR